MAWSRTSRERATYPRSAIDAHPFLDRPREAAEVEGVLRLIHHPARTIDGKRFEAVLEVRIEDSMPTVQEE
jgi:hypothetical protein